MTREESLKAQRARTYFLLAQAKWAKSGDQVYEDVMVELKKALALVPDDLETLLLMSEVANEHGNYEEAHTYYAQAAALAQQTTQPNNAVFQIRLTALKKALE